MYFAKENPQGKTDTFSTVLHSVQVSVLSKDKMLHLWPIPEEIQ
jgi:hypothetical protein